MILHETQVDAIKKAVKWYYLETRYKPYFSIGGYAGTGKSTIISFIIKTLNFPKGSKVIYVAPTGKASLVLRIMGNNANTIHRTFYNCFTDKQGNVRFYPKTKLEEDIVLIIVDEASMVSEKIMNEIISYKVPTIFTLDPGQIPPVMSKSNIFVRNISNIDVLLTKIFRQKEGSGIIDLSFLARSGEYIPYQRRHDALVTDFNNIYDELETYDTILCWKNKSRQLLNKISRKRLGYDNSLYPLKGEKTVILKNNYHHEIIYKDIDMMLVNGMVCKSLCDPVVQKDSILTECVPEFVLDDVNGDQKKIKDHYSINMYKEYFLQYYNPRIQPPDFHKLRKEKPEIYNSYVCADFGYSLSIHKSQGSSFNKTLLIDDFQETYKDMYNKLMYTGITRARNHITIARNFNPNRYL